MAFLLRSFALLGDFARFAFRSGIAALRALARPRDLIHELYSALIGALPLGVVAGVAMGAVVWMHTHSLLARTRTTHYLPGALAAAVLLELAPIGAGLIVAARTGASMALSLGRCGSGNNSMRWSCWEFHPCEPWSDRECWRACW